MMRISELEGKEVIELTTGERLGVIKDCELLVNLATGTVEALLVQKGGWTGKEKNTRTIPWKCIRKISQELIIFEEKASPEKNDQINSSLDSHKLL